MYSSNSNGNYNWLKALILVLLVLLIWGIIGQVVYPNLMQRLIVTIQTPPTEFRRSTITPITWATIAMPTPMFVSTPRR